jgi:hypothetical protein
MSLPQQEVNLVAREVTDQFRIVPSVGTRSRNSGISKRGSRTKRGAAYFFGGSG